MVYEHVFMGYWLPSLPDAKSELCEYFVIGKYDLLLTKNMLMYPKQNCFNTTHDEIITEDRMQWPQGQKITQASKRLWERNHTLNIRYHKKWSILLSKNKSKYLYFNESSAFCSAEKSQGVFYTFYLIIIPPI